MGVSEKRRKKLNSKIILEQILDGMWGMSLEDEDDFFGYISGPLNPDHDAWAFLEGALPNDTLRPHQRQYLHMAQASAPRRSESVALILREETFSRTLDSVLIGIDRADRADFYREELDLLAERDDVQARFRSWAKDL